MKKTILTLVLGTFCIQLSIGQQFIKSKADSLRDEGNLALAIEEYASIYEAEPSNTANLYNYACALSLNRQLDTAFHYLNLATVGDSTVRALNDPDFYYLLKHDKWEDFQDAQIQKVEAKHGVYENLALSKELWTMKIKDQAFYYHIDVADKQLGPRSPVEGAIWELKEEINTRNLNRIIEIIETEGWPKQSIVKGSAASTVFLIIQHSDLETQRKYLPIMTEAANNGEADWGSLALLIDRVNLGEGKQQIYGSQIFRDDDGSYFVKDLEEPEYVNQRRAEVGLGPIEDYLQHWGIEWDVVQREK